MDPIAVWVPLYCTLYIPSMLLATTIASVPVPVAGERPDALRTSCSIKVAVLLSVATCTTPTIAGSANVALVTSIMLIVPGRSQRRILSP